MVKITLMMGRSEKKNFRGLGAFKFNRASQIKLRLVYFNDTSLCTIAQQLAVSPLSMTRLDSAQSRTDGPGSVCFRDDLQQIEQKV